MSINGWKVFAIAVPASVALSIGAGNATPQKDADVAPSAKKSAVAQQKAPGGAANGSAAYKLTSERLERFLKAEKKLSALNESDPKLIKAIATHPNSELRDDWVRRAESRPKVLEAFKAAGTTPREYLQTANAVAIALAVRDSAAKNKPVAKEVADMVPSENLLFVDSHRTELVAWQGGPLPQAVRPNTLEDVYSPPPAAASDSADPVAEPAPTADSAAPATSPEPPAPAAPAKPPKKRAAQERKPH